ncbi:Lto1 [Scenedesmus sp. PABB004]|nr:Lto1 [Scenedesmus sp. PABB004]
MDDPFDGAVQLEAAHIADGAAAGRRAGLAAGLEEGRGLGLAKGFEIGVEVGHYAGCVRAWRALQAGAPGAVPARLERSIAAMEECLAQVPLYTPQDEALTELLEALRGKYKTVTAALGKGGAGAGAGGGEQAPPSLAY